MRSTREYTPCSCGGLAWIERAETHGYRDRIHCPRCGRITVQDNIPMGIHVELASDIDVGRKKEEKDDES
jgi:hypothetical protein